MTDDPKNVLRTAGLPSVHMPKASKLREAALSSESVTAAQYNAWIDPAEMTHPRDAQ